MLARSLVCPLHQDCVISLPGPRDDRFHAVGAQRDPAVPSSALLVPLASSPYLVANAGIGLRVIESPDYSTLKLCQTNQMWGGESSELLVAKSYERAVLHVVNETFCSIHTGNANCRYLVCLSSGASAEQCKHEKKRGSTAVCWLPLRYLSQ